MPYGPQARSASIASEITNEEGDRIKLSARFEALNPHAPNPPTVANVTLTLVSARSSFIHQWTEAEAREIYRLLGQIIPATPSR